MRIWEPILITLLSAAVMLWAWGCEGTTNISTGPSSDAPFLPPETPPLVGTVLGYSHVLELTGARAESVARAGLNFVMVEPFNTAPTFASRVTVADVRAAADVMRRAGGVILIVGINWNDPARRNADQWFVDRVRELAQNVPLGGHVWFEPVSEPWVADSAKAQRWIELGRRHWPGVRIVESIHPCSLSAARSQIGSGRVVVSDCTPMLASRQSRETIVELTRLAQDRRGTWLWYDTFGVPWNDQITLWMREALR